MLIAGSAMRNCEAATRRRSPGVQELRGRLRRKVGIHIGGAVQGYRAGARAAARPAPAGELPARRGAGAEADLAAARQPRAANAAAIDPAGGTRDRAAITDFGH